MPYFFHLHIKYLSEFAGLDVTGLKIQTIKDKKNIFFYYYEVITNLLTYNYKLSIIIYNLGKVKLFILSIILNNLRM